MPSVKKGKLCFYCIKIVQSGDIGVFVKFSKKDLSDTILVVGTDLSRMGQNRQVVVAKVVTSGSLGDVIASTGSECK